VSAVWFGKVLGQINENIIAEARRVLEATDGAGLPVRVMGGVAIRLHAHDGLPRGLQRSYIDIFIGDFRMCHTIDLASRLTADSPTIPLAELLLTKLQIVTLNRKDVVDIAAVLYDHDIGEGDDETVNGNRIARLLASDWGLWRTSQATIETSQAHMSELGLDAAGQELVRDRLERLWRRVEEQPKTFRWRSRARLGERTRWYDEPEEIDHDRTSDRL
jgi:hypothetical protein